MRINLRSAILAALALSIAGSVEAGWITRTFFAAKRDFHRNNGWPEPFFYADREAVEAPFMVQVHNGWRLQNTLSEHHFREGTMNLTEAGELKLKWIMTEAPPQFRTIFVERADTNDITAGRIQAVQAAATRHSPENAVPEVFETSIPARGWSAEYVNGVITGYNNSVPVPRLPERSSSGGGEGN